MKAVVVGDGGREHALAHALAGSPGVREIFCVPGNAGTAALGPAVHLEVTAGEDIAAWAAAAKVDLVVCGDRAALAAGVADACRAAGLRTVGPTAAAAERLGDTAWVAAQMQARRVALASAAERDEADSALALLALADGTTARGLGLARVYRRLEDGGHGPPTAGMGACAPPPGVPPTVVAWLEEAVLRPLVAALAADGAPYQGFLSVEALVDPEERGTPRILAVGPELHPMAAQAVLPLLKTDMLLLLIDADEGTLDRGEITWSGEAACAVTLVSQGYPDVMAFETGYGILGMGEVARGTMLVHEATRNPYAQRDALVTPRVKADEGRPGAGGGFLGLFSFGRGRRARADAQARHGAGDPFSRVVTGGGRVLTAVGVAPTLPTARERAYAAARTIAYTGRVFREDICGD